MHDNITVQIEIGLVTAFMYFDTFLLFHISYFHDLILAFGS